VYCGCSGLVFGVVDYLGVPNILVVFRTTLIEGSWCIFSVLILPEFLATFDLVPCEREFSGVLLGVPRVFWARLGV